jgi:hypothetical protein
MGLVGIVVPFCATSIALLCGQAVGPGMLPFWRLDRSRLRERDRAWAAAYSAKGLLLIAVGQQQALSRYLYVTSARA